MASDPIIPTLLNCPESIWIRIFDYTDEPSNTSLINNAASQVSTKIFEARSQAIASSSEPRKRLWEELCHAEPSKPKILMMQILCLRKAAASLNIPLEAPPFGNKERWDFELSTTRWLLPEMSSPLTILSYAIAKELKISLSRFFNGESLWDYLKVCCDLNSIQALTLSGHGLTRLPKEISLLKNLITLDLSYNDLSTLEGVDGLVKLQELRLNDNCFTQIPAEVRSLKKLTLLDLGSNFLTELQDPLFQLERLQVLILHDNQIRSLPEQTGRLTELLSLNLLDNPISALPQEMTDLKFLSHLSISFVKEFTPPSWMGKLNNLKCLVVDLDCSDQLRCLASLLENTNVKVSSNNARGKTFIDP